VFLLIFFVMDFLSQLEDGTVLIEVLMVLVRRTMHICV